MGGRRRAAVLGSPIAHSLSPVLHRAAYAQLGLDWTYDAIEVDSAGLAGFLAGCGPEWAGLSLTMPLKRAVLPLLDSASELVSVVGGANTVVFGRRGVGRSQHGRRRDHRGPARDRRATRAGDGAGWGSDRRLGAGRAGRAWAVPASWCAPGARRRRPIWSGLPSDSGVELEITGWPDRLPSRDEASIVVCTVPAAAGAGLAGAVPAEPGWLLDVSYSPWPPALVAAWVAAGGRAVAGDEMLLHPGCRAGPAHDRTGSRRRDHAHTP